MTAPNWQTDARRLHREESTRHRKRKRRREAIELALAFGALAIIATILLVLARSP